MVFSFGNLLAVFIVLVILIIYRQLDRNNRSLEKVKKFSDKVRDDLNVLVESKTADMKNLAIEVQVNLKAGKEILKRVRETEDGLKERLSGVEQIRGRLDGYDKALEELVDMTARVEENLKRVQSESVFVDTVGKRIGAAAERLDKVERSVSGLEQRFQEENRAQLLALREEVAADTQAKITELAGVVGATEKRIDDFGAFVAGLEQRGQQMGKQVLAGLKKDFEQAEAGSRAKHTTLLNQFVASLNKVLAEADARGKQLRKGFDEALEAVESRLQEHRRHLAEAVKQGEALEGTVFEGLKDLIARDAAAARESSAGVRKELEEAEALRARLAGELESLGQETARNRAESLQKVDRAVEELQVAALAAAEKQLAGYEQQVEYRFQKLEALGGDIEAMEKNLHGLMERAESRVREEFQSFTQQSAEERQAERQNVEAEFAALKAGMQQLEEGLTELKAKAYENVSTQLQVFEDEFFKDLRQRNLAAEERIQSWQSDLEKRMEQIRSGEVKARTELEKRFTGELERQLEAIKQSSFEQLNVLGVRVATFEKTLESRLGESEERVEEAAKSFADQLQRTRQELDIEYQKQLDALKDAVTGRMQQINREVEEGTKELARSLASSREDLLNVSERITELQRDLAQRTEASLAEVEKSLDAFQQDFLQRSRQMQEELEGRSRELKGRLAEMRDKAETAHGGLSAKVDEGYKLLSLTLTDLDKRVKSFVAQTKIFERSDELKLALETRMEEMKRDMEKLAAHRKETEALETRLAGMRRTVDEVGSRLGKLLSERSRIENMDADFKKLLNVSRELDNRIETVYASQDALQEIQAKIRALEELEKSTQGRFDRLEKKKNIIQATTEGVDKNFQQLDQLGKDLGAARQELDAVGSELAQLRTQAEVLSQNKEKSDQVVEKIQGVDGVLGDLERRMQELEKAREWLAKTETRFEHIGKQAQEQVRLLESILKAEKKQSKLGEGAPPMDKRETVIKLAHLGWSPAEIARTTKLSRGEVELILELAPKR